MLYKLSRACVRKAYVAKIDRRQKWWLVGVV